MSVPNSELGGYRSVSEEELLAAIARAELHNGGRSVDWNRVLAHLGFVHSGAITRKLGPQRRALLDAGAIEQLQLRGFPHFAITRAGRRRLSCVHRRGEPIALPESPQHREWRHKHKLAMRGIEQYRASVREALAQASALLENERADSLAWVAIGECLQDRAQQLGAAIYCLREWAEPEDSRQDEDPRRPLNDRRRQLREPRGPM